MRILIPLDDSDVAVAAMPALARCFDTAENEVHLFSSLEGDAPATIETKPATEFLHPEGREPEALPQVEISQYGPPIAAGGDPPPDVYETRGQSIDRVRADRERFIRALGAEYFSSAAVEIQLVHSGDPGDAIVQFAMELDADLVAMGTRDRGTIGKLLLGSVAEDVLHKSTIPVVLVGPAAQQ